MIKGCSRRMIVLKDTKSEYFDEAYFMLKSGKLPTRARGEKDFIAEANKIVLRASGEKTTPAKPSGKKNFFAGFFAGAGVSLSLFALFSVIF